METFQLRIFQGQVLDQCQFLLWAAHDLNFGLKSDDTDRVLYGLQNFLNAGANISKMFWGSGGSKTKERRRLRDSVGISNNSPLRNVAMRNNFEHMDERVDRWWKESKRHNHLAKVIGPRGAISGVDDIDIFRWFDPTTCDIIFWGSAFNIQDLVVEVEKIMPKLREEAAKPHWDQPDSK
ncbi:MAG: hypothetical protein K0M60_21345 [Hydrogenophaga sp.]|nr:hypothetical protein [Hydrogenophaga sp.]